MKDSGKERKLRREPVGPTREPMTGAFPVVGVGASAGGLEAFTELLGHLPLDTGMAFVLVQHLDPQHESALTQLLSRATQMPVSEASDHLRAQANQVYVIPRNKLLTIDRGLLKLQPRPKTRPPHRPIDSFFESLAKDQGERAVGVVLSGTATDGTLGLEAIKAEGGITFAQDDSARYDSMPRSAVAAGCVDFVLSPKEIAVELARIAKHPYLTEPREEPAQSSPEEDRAGATAHEDEGTPLPSGGRGTPDTGARRARKEVESDTQGRGESGVRKILLLLRSHSGVDFSLYKSTTIQRRITRRMVLSKHETSSSYADFLRGNVKELDALYSDVLISVTSFFRNPEAFAVLKKKVFTKLLSRPGDEPLRVWVLGCSTGQEAYSIAMAFVEASEAAHRPRKLQVFATDLNEALLDKARHGLYAKTLAQDVSPERLRRFFVEEEGGYRVSKALREMVVFARQNFIADPPFSRMDLISCRNLLIYLEPSLQRKIFPTFHYALRRDGFLFLGASETIGGFGDLFEPFDKKQKIFSKRAVPAATLQLPVKGDRGGGLPSAQRPPLVAPARAREPEGFRAELSALREADRLTVNQFAPPGVLINAELQILQFRGPTSAYLSPPTGKATFDLLKMAHEGLMLPLRSAINKAKKENTSVRREGVRIVSNGESRTLALQVIPLRNLKEKCYLVLFEERGTVTPASESRAARRATPPRPATRREESRRIAELESALSETRDYLQSLEEQHEAASEELQASSEEVQSANEELQSINEELETSKEELESANEELITVNEEMANRNAELNRLNSDLVNLQTSTHQAIVLVGRDLAIRRFSAQAERQFGLLATDIGRPLGGLRHNLVFEVGTSDDAPAFTSGDRRRRERSAKRPSSHARGSDAGRSELEAFVAKVIDTVREDAREVRDKDGRYFSLRVSPYLTLDSKVDGAVLVLVDIDELRRGEQRIAKARDYAESIIRAARDAIVVLTDDLRVEDANEAFYATFHVSSEDTKGKSIFELGGRQWDTPKLRGLLQDVLRRNSVFDGFELTHDVPSVGRRTMLLSARPLSDLEESPGRILLDIQDVTEMLQVQAAMRASQTRYKALVEASSQVVWTANANGEPIEDSPSWRDFTGQSFEQWTGSGWLAAIHPDDREPMKDLWTRAVAERAAFETEYRVRRADGQWRWTAVRALPILDGDGSVREWIGMNTDVTERKEAEQKLRSAAAFDEAVMANMKEGLFTVDRDGLVTSMNPAAEELLGWNLAELRGRSMHEVIHHHGLDGTPIPADECMAYRVLRTGEPVVDYEDSFIRRSGTFFDVIYSAAPLRSGDDALMGLVVVFRDVTARKKAEVERKRLEEELASRVDELAAIDAARGRFLAVLSHELRSPLNAIRSWAQIMKRPGSSVEDLRKGADVIERNSRLQSQLIDELLDAHRIQTGKVTLELKRIDLADSVEAAAAAIEPVANEKSIRLERDIEPGPAPALADPGRLQQVLGNLLTNAMKFTPQGGRVRVSLRKLGSSATVSVEDSGEGISSEALPFIFEAFRQADSSASRSHGGLGLGLSVAKQIMGLHGGSIEASSEGKGRGATFTATIPLRSADEEPRLALTAGSEASASATLSGIMVLVVDDEPDSREPVRRVLEDAGAEVIAVSSAAEAIEAVREQRPDVLVSDLAMPGKDGFELLRSIRSLPPGRGGRIPAVALTGLSGRKEREMALGAGFAKHLVKPVEPLDLVSVVAALAHPEEANPVPDS